MTSKTITRKVTSKHQVSLPPEVMEFVQDNLINFVVQGDKVFIEKNTMSLEETFGSVPTPPHLKGKTESDIEAILAAETAKKHQKKFLD
jgi:bifunctional DNA-binding transcriptional regulator/antitoxin component of YhaV-PrlF toxin-antitoxin module